MALHGGVAGSRLGIGTLLWGRWAEPHEAPSHFPTFRERLAVPFELPMSAVRPSTVRVFNAFYYRTYPRALRRSVVAPWGFFYPLDGVRNWNRLYGRSGLAQYQCVFPTAAGTDPIHPFFETFGSLGGASPVTVVKDCGPEGNGMLSFPEAGLSAAIDIPLAVGDPQRIVDRLNEIVIAAGGRIYLAKDSLSRPQHFRAMEPRLAAFDQVRRKWDPDGRLESRLGERLLGMAS